MTEIARPAARRALCVAVDAEGYSGRDTKAQHDLQAALPALINAATAEAGLDRLTWEVQQQGDGELAVVPRDQDERLVVDDFVRRLDANLDSYNAERRDDARLRLRLAMHFGIATPSENGFVGSAPVIVSRLLGSTHLRAALADNPGSDLVVALSDGLYEDLILGRHTSLPPAAFSSCLVQEKTYEGRAWIRVLRRESAVPATGSGAPVPAPAPNPTPEAGTGGSYPAAAGTVVNHISGGHIGVAGFQNNFGRSS